MPLGSSLHETDFCAQIASFANGFFDSHPDHPFGNARIEGFGAGGARRKRKDLRFYDRSGHLAMCGEVKLPGSHEGRSPYAEKLLHDAHQKADNAGVKYFFTWNVNTFVLWDRSKWDVPLLDRRVREWQLGLNVSTSEEATHVFEHIQSKFLPTLLSDIADILTGRRRDWGMPPDDIFIRSLESHLDWPIQITSNWLIEQSNQSRSFDQQIQEWMAGQDWTFVRKDARLWRMALHRAASSLAYVLANRLIFYKALRDRFGDLPALRLAPTVRSADQAHRSLQGLFEKAVRRSGDYEPLFYPHEQDWASQLVFQAPAALDAWRAVLRGILAYDFQSISSDVVGRIFQRLIGPEERHRYGQHFTGDDVVDVINSFCIRKPEATVLDPACGSGSFLVRAYYRKKTADPRRPHTDLLAELFGCDISLYPAHLATLNLAAREINEEANYPRIARLDFLNFRPTEPFCRIPSGTPGREAQVLLPALDAVVANPPYVRQEKVENKDVLQQLTASAWRALRLSGRSDLHCYFWPASTRLLKPDGWFGFLTSSSWLDVEYGFVLQAWILQNFKIHGIFESADEAWFPDARVKTCITILQPCQDDVARMANRVKFVRFSRPLSEIIGVPPGDDELARQRAVDALRDRIETTVANDSDDKLRILVKLQGDLWRDGVRAAGVVREQSLAAASDAEDEEQEESQPAESVSILPETYAAGKWGRYLRAPDFYFEMMSRFGPKFVPLGKIAEIRRGITSGCDAFFMPRDSTAWALSVCPDPAGFRERFGLPRRLVESGTVKIVKAGDGSVHPIESEFLRPEVHSLMDVDRPNVSISSLDRFILLVGQPLSDLRGTRVGRYLHYGQTQTFPSKKSDPVPVPRRSTCAARDPWYDLTELVKPGIAFWPKSQQYRHIIAANPEKLICGNNLYDISADGLSPAQQTSLIAILNSTLIGLFKTFYGRFAGTEGNLKTEVVDVNLLEVPDPRQIPRSVASRLRGSLLSLSSRPVGRLVEEALMNCHSPDRARRIAEGPLVLPNELRQADRRALDDAVFELLGVAANERIALIDRLYEETARHFRHIRVVEIQKMEQRSASRAQKFSSHELAADAWDAVEGFDLTPLLDWLVAQPGQKLDVNIAPGKASLAAGNHMFDNRTVYFGKNRQAHLDCSSRAQAELVLRLAELDISGEVQIPLDEGTCARLLAGLDDRIAQARAHFESLAGSRTGTQKLRDEILSLMMRWFLHGRP